MSRHRISQEKEARVTLVFRKPSPSAHSIEFLFHAIYAEIRNRHLEIGIDEYVLPRYSKGVWNRLCNMVSLARFRSRVVHISGDSYYAILGSPFARRLLTIHDLHFLSRTKGLKKKLLKAFWLTLPVRFAHKITVVSETTKDAIMLEMNVDSEKIEVVYNFIDPIFKPCDRNFQADSPRILQIGTAFNKNLANLAKALKGLQCTLVVVGKLSNEQMAMLKSADINFESRFHISLGELFEEYCKADLLTFVSTVEGFGLPILEAQATGLPVVTSNCSSMPEVAGNGAILVDPFDAQDIRRGVEEILHNSTARETLITNGYENVKRFSQEQVASTYARIYKELMN